MRGVSPGRAGLETKLAEQDRSQAQPTMPAHFNSYAALLEGLKKIANRAETVDAKARVIKQLVHEVQVKPQGISIHFYAGDQEIKRGLTAKEGGYIGAGKNLSVRGSNTLCNGGPTKNRTWN